MLKEIRNRSAMISGESFSQVLPSRVVFSETSERIAKHIASGAEYRHD